MPRIKKLRTLLAAGAWFLAAVDARAAFKESGWGARAISMGGAYAAVADDADALDWNPAGAAQLRQTELMLMHADLFAGLQNVDLGLNSFSFVQPFDNQKAVGLAVTNSVASKLYREDSFAVSYSQNLTTIFTDAENRPAVFAGANIKYLRNSFTLDSRTDIDPVFAGGKAQGATTGDLGLLVRAGKLSFGAAAKNLTQPDLGFREEDKVPLEWRTGLAYTDDILFFENATLALDYSRRDDDSRLFLGWENWFFKKTAAFRAGANDREFAAGLGYRRAMPGRWELGFNYAHVFPLKVEGDGVRTHRFSLIARFGRARETATPVYKKVEIHEEQQKPITPAETVAAPPPAVEERKDTTAVKQAQEEYKNIQRLIETRKMNPIQFVTASDKILADSLPALDKVVDILKRNPQLSLRVEGHTDGQGAVDKNQRLSEARAATVANYMIIRGIARDRLQAAGFGSSKPLVGEKTPEDRAKNRRVEFIFFE